MTEVQLAEVVLDQGRVMADARRVVFPPHVQDRIRQIAESAPPLTPEQQAVIRGCCTKPPAPKARAA